MKSISILFAKSVMIVSFSVLGYWVNGQNQHVKLNDAWEKQGISLLKDSPQKLQINFSVEDYVVTPISIDNEAMSAITMEGVILQNNEGTPNLPAFSKFIAVPHGATVSVTIPKKELSPSQV